MEPLSSLPNLLLTGQIQGLALTLFENERPPCGLAGLMDWHLHGKISHYLKQGALSGQAGECAYFPIQRNGSTFHLILVGAGTSKGPGIRSSVSDQTLEKLHKNLLSLKLLKIGISQSDFGVNSETLTRYFEGISLWITQ